jgi:hypothetical protein
MPADYQSASAWGADREGADLLLRAPIREADREKIAHGNAERLLGLQQSPRTLWNGATAGRVG